MTEQKNIGLALGGGAILGAAHIGVLHALEEYPIKVNHIAGTSIGALVGALYAFGKTWDEIRDIAFDMNWIDISQISLSRYGLLSNAKIAALIKKHIGDQVIEDADIAFAAVATNVSSGEKRVFQDGSVADAVMASTSVPGIFKPVEIGDQLYVDGGIVENVPIPTVKDMGADFIIGVDLNAVYGYSRPGNLLEVILNSFHFTFMTATRYQSEQADLVIQPDMSKFNRSDVDQVEDMIEQGYQDAKDALDALF